MTSSCGNVSQVMTRYLHLIINSRHSWNSFVFVQDQGKQELHFWRDNLKTLNGVLFWPTPFVPSKVLFSDTSISGCGAFVQGSSSSLKSLQPGGNLLQLSLHLQLLKFICLVLELEYVVTPIIKMLLGLFSSAARLKSCKTLP